jgi:hypothetical protein
MGDFMARKRLRSWNWSCNSSTSGIYFLGFIGAVVYNLSVATGFWMVVWGCMKAIVWPAFLVFKLMQSLGM